MPYLVKARFKPNHTEFSKFARSAQMRDPLAQIALLIAAEYRLTAPRSTGKGPHMADKVFVNRRQRSLRIGAYDRTYVTVEVPDPAAVYTEFGNKHTTAGHYLAKAAAHFGDYRGVMPDD